MKTFKGKKLLTGLLSVMLIIGFGTSIAMAAAVPTTVTYQAELANVSDTSFTMTFYLFDGTNHNEAQSLWSEMISVTPVNSVVSATLGESITITEDDLNDAQYLGIKIKDGALMQPLTKLTSSIFAMRAKIADELARDAIAFTLDYAAPGSIKADHLAVDSVENTSIKNGAVTSVKTSESVKTINPSTTPVALDADDQGLVLVSGNTTIQLPDPTNSTGLQFTIKKIDGGLQRKMGSKSPDPCGIRSNIVTIQVGDGTMTWFSDHEFSTNAKIENRTNKVQLLYKNAYATFVSNGTMWYISNSHSTVDIINPMPGDNGNIIAKHNGVETDDLTSIPITLRFTPASDFSYHQCADLVYLPVYSKSNDHKLLTIDEILSDGFKCAANWITLTDTSNPVEITCDPQNYGYSPVGEIKMNIIVRDEAGNMTAYVPPGDIDPPTVPLEIISELHFFVNSEYDTTKNQPYFYAQWASLTDTVTKSEEIQYKLIYEDSNGTQFTKFDWTAVSGLYNDGEIIESPVNTSQTGQYKCIKFYKDNADTALVAGEDYTFHLSGKDKAGNVYNFSEKTFTAKSN